MIKIQVVPRGGSDVYGLLRAKTTSPIHPSTTPVLRWSDKPKPYIAIVSYDWQMKAWLKHISAGYIQVSTADGVLAAEVRAGVLESSEVRYGVVEPLLTPQDLGQFGTITGGPDTHALVAEFIGRLVQWFPQELFAINIQFVPEVQKLEEEVRPRVDDAAA